MADGSGKDWQEEWKIGQTFRRLVVDAGIHTASRERSGEVMMSWMKCGWLNLPAAAVCAVVLGCLAVHSLQAEESRTGMPPVIVSSVSESDISGFQENPPGVRELLRSALALTSRKLGYLFGSADPARGGMDCSGTIHFLLREAGVKDPPRSSRDLYVWVRKSGTFRAVVSSRADSFEFADLKPGDLLFWTGTYNADRDPPVTHAMIYLGKARADGRALMVGASDGRTYRGAKQFGVSVFDFRLPRPQDNPSAARFIGYGAIPGLMSAPPSASSGDANRGS